MSNSKLKVLQQFPTARAAASPDGKLWRLIGVHGVVEAQAPSESQLWDDALKYIKKWPEAQDRYLLKAEYFEQFNKTPT
ncbi:hypothetical protein GTP58_20220 [Duganella sp. CY15W]|uniref:hypothetical protein n=1 Tax=Duganella sp. CY15W TaxID=2692172 RepID=UPI00136AF593|nr:hypothetical protein [Duganella sp. CY15W]MYM30662.1 hypothetical protein [Duganella sp. CY15W]